ncbi:MAG: hypothetical protein EG822_06660 [Deltaproteobacteria bacterium]|nr:hypothetical protein [Deltaproteobacteria bacterium]TLN01504.1 MAG: hypothetical protein FDZ73_15610 [bacterium]
MPRLPVDRNNEELQDYYQAGVKAAYLICHHVDDPGFVYPDDPLNHEFASGALNEFSRIQKEQMRGLMGKIVRGAQLGAQQLMIEKWHGIIEVLQNADDLGATTLRLLVEETQTGWRLCFCHNGAPVRIQNVMAMTYAFFTTKEQDAEATGRFGVGLKTLGRIGDRIEVHSGPYSFAIENQLTTQVARAASIPGFYDATTGETLLTLACHTDFDPKKLEEWLGGFEDQLLIYLRAVSSFRIETPTTLRTLELTPAETTQLPGGITCQLIIDNNARPIDRFSRSVMVPIGLTRSGKSAATTARVGIAVGGDAQKTLYATLPTRISTNLAFSINGDFDPGTSRENLQDTPWNEWLLQEVGELLADVALYLLEHDPPSAWTIIPLPYETKSNDAWLATQLETLQQAVFGRICAEGRVQVGERLVALAELCFEAPAVDGLLLPGDAERITGQTLLPPEARDSVDFRAVLEACGAIEIDLASAFNLMDEPETFVRPPDWRLALVAQALAANETELLTKHACFVTTSGVTRLLPRRSASEWIALAEASLPLARLQLVRQLHPDYADLSEFAVIRETLLEEFNLVEQVSGEQLLEALAHRPEPVFLNDRELYELKRLFEQHGSERLGQLLGGVIELSAQMFKAGGKRVPVRALANRCYLPASIAKDRAGSWAKASEGVPGIYWAHPSHAVSLRGSKRVAGREHADLGSRKFLQALGCEIAPRLVALPPRSRAQVTSQHQATLLQVAATCVTSDYAAPDLELVLARMVKTKIKERQQLAVALYTALAYSWNRLYEGREEARAAWPVKNKYESLPVTADWLCRLKEEPWLVTMRRHGACPPGLAVASQVNRAIYGASLDRLVAGISEAESHAPLCQSLGMLVAPRAANLLTLLADLKRADPAEWPSRAPLLTRALAERCAVGRGGRVDDMNHSELEQRLHQGELLYIPKQDRWVSPRGVFTGRDIFHGRRPFVPTSAKLDPLWRVIGLRAPNLTDALAVLDEVAQGAAYGRDEERIVLESLQLVARSCDTADDEQRRILARLPLWAGGRYYRSRPLYATASTQLAERLSGIQASGIHIWQPPFDIAAKRELLRALRVTLLEDGCLTVGYQACRPLDEPVHDRYNRALDHMYNYLAREADRICLAADWEILRQSRIQVANGLRVDVAVASSLGGRN